MDQENISASQPDKKVKSYAQTALFGGILLVIFGFGFGFVNLAILLITLVTAIAALLKNKGVDKKIMTFSWAGLGLVVLAFFLNGVLGLRAPIDYLVGLFSGYL